MAEVLTPRIYIGAGGSGRRMVALIKAAVEADPHLTEEDKRAFQFLAVDADEYQEKDCQPLDRHAEYVHAAGFSPSLARQADYMKQPVEDWWYDSYTPPYIQQGAGAVRLIGRLCYYYHYPRIRDAFQQAVQRATNYAAGRQVASEISVYVIGSLAGGTGSSMLLDLGFMARKHCSYRQVYVNAVIMLPDVFTVTQVLTQQKFKDRWMANGYAALKELVYFNEQPKEFRPVYRPAAGREEPIDHPRMFDQCFFIQPVLGNTSTVADGDNIFKLAAQSLYLFTASAHGSRTGSVLVNTDGVHYASLGMQAITYPHEFVVKYARHWGTARLLRTAMPQDASSEQERVARELLKSDLTGQDWARLDEFAEKLLAQMDLGEPPELDPEGDLGSEVAKAADYYKTNLTPLKERLAALAKQREERICEALSERVEQLLGEGHGLNYVFAYLRELQAQLDGQVQRMDGEVKRKQQQHAQEEQKLRAVRAPRGIRLPWAKKNDDLFDEAEETLERLFGDEVPLRFAQEAALAMGRTILSHWLRPRLHRFEQLRGWALESEIRHQEEMAAKVAEELDLEEHNTPHTHFCMTGKDLPTLVNACLPSFSVGGKALKSVWHWVSNEGTEEAREGLLAEIEQAVAESVSRSLDLSMLEAWKKVARPDELRDRFRKAALTCRPFWSYVQEQADEHMTRVFVLAMPREVAWDDWLKDMRLDYQRVDGDARRVVFLTVEGCRSLKHVHLKELPEWFRTYEQVQRAYDSGADERPLHVHKHWNALPEVDDSLPASAWNLYAPAKVRGRVVTDGNGYMTLLVPAVPKLRFPGMELPLGSGDEEALQTMVSLPEKAAAALRAWMAEEDGEALKGGVFAATRPYVDKLRDLEAQGRPSGATRAMIQQLKLYIGQLRRKKIGMEPGLDPAAD